MRTEAEVLDQLLDFANRRDDVRAAILNGSRVNPGARKDLFADYDVVFVVEDPDGFKRDRTWISGFGDLLISQQNDCSGGGQDWCIFLMLFSDGVRIDLTFFPLAATRLLYEDSLKKLLLDKDGIFEKFDEPNESFYFTKRPTEVEFLKTLNEFWWCLTNVAKGIWRNEPVYTKSMFETIVRPQLLKVIEWHIGMEHDWQVNTGKFGKRFQEYLAPDLWESLAGTYPGPRLEELWPALSASAGLVRKLGRGLAERLRYPYALSEAENVTAYLKKVEALPKDASEFD